MAGLRLLESDQAIIAPQLSASAVPFIDDRVPTFTWVADRQAHVHVVFARKKIEHNPFMLGNADGLDCA